MNSKKHKLPRRPVILSLLLVVVLSILGAVMPTSAEAEPTLPDSTTITGGDGNRTENIASLNASGVTIVENSVSNTTYNIGDGQVVMIANQNAEVPITFENCTFNLSGGTVKITGTQTGTEGTISYNNGETVTKLFISGNVTFENCLFVTEDGATKTTDAGYDAAIYFFSGNINLNSCTLSANGYNGQFLGLYGEAGEGEGVTFTNSIISTKDNRNGWSYAMYAGSVLKLNHSMMMATGSSTESDNINVFYSGDIKENRYNAVYIENQSIVKFSDNASGGFALNNVNMYVNDSQITVNDNLGNASNSGYWFVQNSIITMTGNKGGHALSCNGFEMTESKLEILHNGYAGVYIGSDSSLSNCTVDIRCNGERMLSYSAGDVWLNGHTLTVTNCTSDAQEGSAWLGAVARTGSVVTPEDSSVVAYDLNSNADDNLKSNTESVLASSNIALNDDLSNGHTLLLNPFMKSDYARGNTEKDNSGSNDADLFKDREVTTENDPTAILGSENAKIGTLTDAQLSHHKYDWSAGTIKYEATSELYGAMEYPCIDVCSQYEVSHSTDHPYSFNCEGTYVYAPLVGLEFKANAGEDTVDNMPNNQTSIAYNGTATAPTTSPVREGYVFTGWYSDEACAIPFNFNTSLTKNWTIAYAGWQKIEGTITIAPADLSIYMGGSSGYEAVVNGSGQHVATDSLPQPIFKLTVSDDTSDLNNVVFQSGEREWTATQIKDVNGDATPYYSLEATGHGGQDPVRVTYTGDDEIPVISDAFNISEVNDLFTTYEIALYTGDVQTEDVTATINGKTYSVDASGTGTLTVRTVVNTDNNAAVTPVTTESPTSKLQAGTGLMVVDEDTTYTVNDLGIPMPEGQAPSLLFDSIVTSDGVDREGALENAVAARVSTSGNRTRYYQSQYLDLVDADNGNIWLKASEPVTVYWAYPNGTDASDDFTLWHFEGLHRDNSSGGSSGFNMGDIDNATLEQVKIEKEEYGISFTVEPGGFSPFVLIWTKGSGGGGGTPGTTPGGDDKPETPVLNTEDHYLYIEGYPEDYRTGEYSDDESLWPVKPEGNITRAEVATIFYRLLKDEVRDEIETTTNNFTDVNEGDWFNVTVSSLANMDVLQGYGDGTFRPNNPITRAELSAIAVRFFENFEAIYDEGTFTDVTGDEWYADAIAAAEELGILAGYPDGTVRPESNITRAETCAIVNRVLDRRPHEDHLGTVEEMRTWPDNLPGAWYYADMQEATNGHYYDWITIDGTEFEEWTEVDKDYDWTKR